MNPALKITSLIVGLSLSMFACKKADTLNKPLSGSLGKPGPVTNITVKNDSAVATLTYTLPANADLLYVKAVYKLANGASREVKSSMYTNVLKLDGFGDTLQHEVNVYSANKAEELSDPVKVMVKPLENPIWGVFRNLKVVPDFAGIRVTSKNPSRFNVAIEILKDSLGQWFPFSGIYTEAAAINTPVRGMDTVPQKLALFVRDRFMNRTDTMFVTLTPFYETALPKSGYKTFPLPGDAASAWPASNFVYNLWDGNTETWPYVYLTAENGLPSIVTFDMGKLAQLSRIRIWDYPEYLNSGRAYYYAGCPRLFEIWASPNPPLDGSFNNWTLMATCESIKESGLPYGQITAEDRTKGFAGFNYDLRPDAPKMRYIRIRCLENWAGGKAMSLSEVQVYGDPR